MLSKRLQKQMTEQVKNELYSAYFYLAMATWLERMALRGFANWFHVQVQEEYDHAMKMLDYMVRAGADIDFPAIGQPPAVFEGPMDICRKTLAHEQLVTSLIHQLMDIAQQDKDGKSIDFLQWYIDEQVEEEENATDLIERLTAAQAQGEAGVLSMDGELASREYHPLEY